ncbi:MAG TPA: hypothetical protein VEQ65_07895 [Opitutus sp.]|nr:hypothetical protein [Opitutus sp.]
MPPALLVRLVLWVWFIAAFFAGRSLLLQRLPAVATPLIALGLTGLLVLVYRLVAPVRAWANAIDVRALVLLHVTRLVGLYLLFLYREGELPSALAVPAGVGDTAVAVLALVVVFFPFAAATRTRALYLWNVVGFVDLLLVLVTAARLGLGEPRAVLALTQLPLSLLPTLLVPLLLASHLLVFARLARERS